MADEYSTVVIYSVGLLGGSIGLGLKNSGFSGRVIGLSSEGAIATAKRLGCIDEGYGYEALERAAAGADVLFLCSPIQTILSTLDTLGRLRLPEGLIITDVGSTKKMIMEKAARALPPQVNFIGGHPMAGSEKKGPAQADPYLFQNAVYVLSLPSAQRPGYAGGFAAFLTRYLGCRTLFLDPEVHDTIAAMVSHVPHILAVALVNVAQAVGQSVPGTLDLAAGGFRDMTRIASSPYAMWNDIFLTNKEKIAPLIDRYIGRLTEMKKMLEQDRLGGAFDDAAGVRRLIPLSSKGFISPLNEILVVVKDQPGVIASISASLASSGINIKDIEVLKVREGEGGTLRLAFESREKAAEAIRILTSIGFTARERE
jgi:prephenate dehydrogenase